MTPTPIIPKADEVRVMSRRQSQYKVEIRCMDYEHNGITCKVSFYNEDDDIDIKNDAGQELALSAADLIPLANMLRAIDRRLREEWKERNEAEAEERKAPEAKL